ncbi:alpha/beta hydrolase [Consotaella aegiceratis]|uniref:alpha/beta hydrolase n=1 Tax=Consotaella aegiceratis TaxID=3097961 RepID=UPI002F3F9BCD
MKSTPAIRAATVFDDIQTLDSPSGAALAVRLCRPSGMVRAVVIVSHGLSEHSGRYAAFAERLAEDGLATLAYDHRGHGSTTAPDAPLRRFARRNGPSKLLTDLSAVRAHAGDLFAGAPAILFGHSLGGLIALAYAIRHGTDLAGVAAWNTGVVSGASLAVGQWSLKTERALKGSDVASRVMARATFEAWAQSIKGRRTEFDWLSHDPEIVDAYVADPLCGWSPTISMWEDVLALNAAVATGLPSLPADLPVHLLGGTGDPVTKAGRDVEALSDRLWRAGSRQTTMRLIRDARHEALNEPSTYREPAFDAFLAWLKEICLTD